MCGNGAQHRTSAPAYDPPKVTTFVSAGIPFAWMYHAINTAMSSSAWRSERNGTRRRNAARLLRRQILQALHRQVWRRLRLAVETVLQLDGYCAVQLRVDHHVRGQRQPGQIEQCPGCASSADQAAEAGPSPEIRRKSGPPAV